MVAASVSSRPEIAVFIGMPRAGSTSVYHQLDKHPSIFAPYRKETFFFSFYHDRGVEWYRNLYSGMKDSQVGIDTSADYFYDPRTIDRILEFNPSTRVILCVRDPVDWALSVYNHLARDNPDAGSFSEFVKGHQIRVGESEFTLRLENFNVPSMVNRIRSAFENNLLLYDFRYFCAEPLAVYRAMESFLGVPGYFDEGNFKNLRFNASNQRNIALLSGLLRNERMIGILHAIMPEGLLKFGRDRYYALAARGNKSDPGEFHARENKVLAENIFAGQRREISEIFKDNPIQSGDGTPFTVDGY